ncbi:MAG: carboxylesterase/lipase family protein [Bacteroidales bacterium]|nr:carboxylesterase/lipase family protein [Bacteroidales bacterium]
MRTFSRRQFLKSSVAISGSLLLLPSCGSPKKDEAGNKYVIAKTTYGKVRGIRQDGVNIFKGIPYAGSVSGQYRFGRPAPLEEWSGVRDALRLGTPAMQLKSSVYGIDEPDPGEDCLFLNIWTPANDNVKRPVMFYNHGGGYATGSGGSVAQDGANLARYFDVVVVETNHRLNIFGYLYLGEMAGNDYNSSGNNGLLDIVDGLKWVHDNIAEFGGDPNNVMIWGESGGGMKTSCLYSMECAAPYFHKASIESGPCISVGSVENAAMVTELLLQTLDIDKKNWRTLFDVPAQRMYESINELYIKAAEERANGGPDINVSFSPVLDGVVINRHPFGDGAPDISKDKPLIVGWNEDEYAFFVMTGGDVEALNLDETDYKGLERYFEPLYGEKTKRIIETYRKSRPDATPANIWMEVMSVTMMGNGSIKIAEAKARQGGASAYLYNFGYKSEVTIPGTNYPLGTPHAMDIPFKFNNVRKGNPSEGGMAGEREEKYQASLNFAELWTTFAFVGKPGGKELPEWEPYNLVTRPLMRIDSTCELIHDRYPEERTLWSVIG